AQCEEALRHVDGVMLGREIYSNPFLLANVDQAFYGSGRPTITREQVIEAFIEYCREQMALGVRLNHLSRHILGLYQGLPGARQFRRVISEQAHKAGADVQVLQDALSTVRS